MSDESDRRQRFLEEVNAGYAALRAELEASAAHTAGIAEWDAVLADGLQDERAVVTESWGVLRRLGEQVQQILKDEDDLLDG
jgi:hypothetical protein